VPARPGIPSDLDVEAYWAAPNHREGINTRTLLDPHGMRKATSANR
jgi:hypothetical protein